MARYPYPLQPGDTICVICPSDSLASKHSDKTSAAIEGFEKLGLRAVFSEYCFTPQATVEQKLADLHAAFLDDSISGIFAGTGGFSSIEILSGIDYSLIKSKPKILCGYSDITVLLNAIYAKTGLVTYHGPNFNGVGSNSGQEYTHKYLKECLMGSILFEPQSSGQWFDKRYCDCHADGEESTHDNQGWWPINKTGIVDGTLIGGNIGCFSMLTGTDYFPKTKQSILLLEADYELDIQRFDALLQSLIMQRSFRSVQGILIGRFQEASQVTREALSACIARKPALRDLPIIANIDVGHTSPKLTLPIGGVVQITSLKDSQLIKVVEH